LVDSNDSALTPEYDKAPILDNGTPRSHLGRPQNTVREPLAPIDVVNRILLSDPVILAVLAVDEKGSVSAKANKRDIPESEMLSEELGRQAARLGSIIIGAVSQFGSLYGHLETITFRYKRAKVLVMLVPRLKLFLMIRLIASANVDYVINSVEQIIGLD
jgi:hypothetical protein